MNPSTQRSDHSGILILMLATLFFMATNTTVRYLSTDYHIGQIIWARFTFHFLWFLPLFFLPRNFGKIQLGRWRPQLLRSGLLFVTNFAFFMGVAQLTLATAASLMFIGPLLLVSLSALLLGEKVGPRRWVAVAVGFLGVVVITRPGFGFEVAMLFPLLAALLYAVYQLITRRLSATDNPTNTFFFTPIVGAAVSTCFVYFVWKTPTLEAWLLLLQAGFTAGCGQYLLIKAFQRSEASLLAPFGYSTLVWATLFGFIVFGNLPDIWTISGATVVILAGLYIWYRERTLGKTTSSV